MAICGIAVNGNEQLVPLALVQAMTSAVAVKQSDHAEYLAVGAAGMGAVSPTGSTSLFDSDRLTVVCDADLYNQEQLLGSLDVRPQKTSTAALLAALYGQRGTCFLSQIRGPFALAIWDKKSRTLSLARDRFGIRSLCYANGGSELVFASYPRGIFAGDRRDKQVNYQAILDYLIYNVVPAPATAFEGVSKVRPGELVMWRHGAMRRERYWEMQYREDARGSEEQLAAELLSHIEQAVRVSSAGLDPERVGCFLSGGTDSSTVVGLFSRIHGCRAHTFSIGFNEARFNELEYARLAAGHFNSRHSESILSPGHASRALARIVDAYDEPFANSSAIPTYWCASLAREHGIDVMLAGDGGDELFGGNERYRTHQVYEYYQRVPGVVRKLFEPVLFAAPEAGILGKAQRYVRRSNTPNPERYCEWRLLRAFAPEHVLGDSMPRRNGDLLAVINNHYRNAPAISELNRLLYIDVKMTLGDEDLPKVVRTAELAGVSVRFPMLDNSLADFSGTLPSILKVRGLEKRYLFKLATRNLLPSPILKKKKHGFGLPIGFWLKTDPQLRAISRDVLLDPKTYQRGYFQRPFIEHLMAELEKDNTPYFGDLLWVFLMLELWHRRHVEGAAL